MDHAPHCHDVETSAPLTVRRIVERAGGPKGIAQASNGAIGIWAVYKWPMIGIPERHWPLVIRLTGLTAEELLQANAHIRAEEAAE